MKKEPMTYKRLCELKPSDDNPVVLEKISKISTSGNCVKIKSSHLDKNGHMWAISGENSIYTIGRHNLSSYYHKIERKVIELTEVVYFSDAHNRYVTELIDANEEKDIDGLGVLRKMKIDAETFEVIIEG